MPKPTFSSSRQDFAMEACDPDLPPPEPWPNDGQAKMTKFAKEVGEIINKYSLESASDTPDFILAHYLAGCLAVFEAATNARERWYGRIPLESIVSPNEGGCPDVAL